MFVRTYVTIIVITLIVTAASPLSAQYDNSSRINSLLRERSIGANTAATKTAVPKGSIADRFRARIAAVHGGSPSHTPPRPTPRVARPVRSTNTTAEIRQRLAATRARRQPVSRPVAQANKGSFFSSVERLKRERAARVRGEMPYSAPKTAARRTVAPRPVARRTYTTAPSSNVRQRLQAMRQQSLTTLGAFRRSLTSEETAKLNNWMRKNKFRAVPVPRRNGETALHRACEQGHREIATLILCSGAHVNAEDRHGETPIQQASARGQGDMVDLLLRWKADPNIRDHKGRTALQKASNAGHLSIVNLLLNSSADLNARCDQGHTALHEAAGHGHIEIVKVLVAAGSDVHVRCAKNETAVQKSACAGHNEIARLLLQQK